MGYTSITDLNVSTEHATVMKMYDLAIEMAQEEQ